MSLAEDIWYPEDTEAQDKAEREGKLLRILKAEEEDSLGYSQSEISGQQIDAFARYYGHKYGDEEDGRSSVTTREVFECIEWTRPDLLRVFASGGNVVYLQETSEADEKYAKDAADYLAWMFFSDNNGFELLDDFGFDGLLHRRGYLAVYWRDKEYQAPQTFTGLNIMQVQELMNDPQIEIIGQDFDNESEAGGITLMVRRLKSPARAEICSKAPEDMRFSGRMVDIDKGRYVGCVNRMLCGEAARLWPEKAQEIVDHCGAADPGSMRSEDVRAVRFGDDENAWMDTSDQASIEVEILEEYLRIDLNGDGYPELIRSYRMGDLLLEESEVEENPFASWTPIRIPHRFMGLSMHEIMQDLQRQSTVITRAGLDALYQSVVNREAYNRNTVNVETLTATYSGAKVEVDGPPGEAILPLTGGLNTAAVAWEALGVIGQRMEDRTGSSRQTKGLDSDQLTKEHSGKALGMLQLNADARKEMVARNMGAGLGAMFSKLYRLVCRNQNEARQAKVGGKWCKFDPRTWNSDLRVSIYSGGVNREHTMMGLQLIANEQDKVIEALGPGNPNVTAKNRYRYQEELCRAAGFKSAEPFFTEVPDEPEMGPDGQPVMDPETGQPKMKPWAPPPQEDPAMAKVKADTQAKQADLQMQGQAKQAEMQMKGQEMAAALQMQQQKDAAAVEAQREKAALDLELAREKAAAEIQLANQKAQAEFDLARGKMEMELALARERMSMEMDLERERIASQERVGKAKAAMSGDDSTISKNRSGGDLSE